MSARSGQEPLGKQLMEPERRKAKSPRGGELQVLCGDIGGTHTRLLVAEVDGVRIRTILRKDYPSKNFECFDKVLETFLAEVRVKPHAVCLAVAGPVRKESADVTNLPWHLGVGDLQERYSFSQVSLINDFSAAAYGIAALDESELRVVQGGRVDVAAPRVVLGAGTGLGFAQSICHHDTWQVLPSQAGHNAFGPVNPLQCDLLRWLFKQQDHVCNEDVLSGKGLVNLYRYCAEQSQEAESENVRQVLALADSAAAISERGMRGDDGIATQALRQFVQIYGAVAGDAALFTLAFGGVFIAGGIAPKIAQQLCGQEFRHAFRYKGKMSSLMSDFPVRIIMNEQVGLLGAALYAAQS